MVFAPALMVTLSHGLRVSEHIFWKHMMYLLGSLLYPRTCC